MAMSSVASAMALVACTPPAASSQTSGGNATPAPQKTQLIFWGHDQHPMDLAAEGFAQTHPNVEWVPIHSDDWLQKLKGAMAATIGGPDLIWAEATDAQDWGCHDLLSDLTTVLKLELNNYHALKLNETFIAKSGKYIGWPGDLGVSGWYYREDKLKEAGYNDIDFEKLTWPDF